MSTQRRGSLTLGAVIAGIFAIAGAVWWTRPPSALITTAQILALLPVRSTLHSVVQVDLDGAMPFEAAAVAMIPEFPGAATSRYTEIVAQYNRWGRRLEIIHRRPLTGLVPVSVDGGRILGNRDGVLFQGVTDEGRWSFLVIGEARGRIAVLAEGDSGERVTLADPWVIDRGRGHALRWDGTRFAAGPVPASPTLPATTVTWRFALRNGTVYARTNQVLLQPRQVLRLQRNGGGTTPIVLPDGRLDVVENGFRARRPGTYSIRLLIPFSPTEEAYVLSVLVSETGTMGP